MNLSNVGDVIASRDLVVGDATEVKVVLGKPALFPDGNGYYCPFLIQGLGDGMVRYAGGEDPIQALELALKKIGAILYTSPEGRSGNLKWPAAPREGDLGFPVPDSLSDLLPKGSAA